MITGRILFTAAAMALSFPVLASAPPAANDTPPPATADQSAAQLIKNCDAHKFETVVHETVDGQPQQSKVKLCGKEGQSDADWIGTLKDAVTKVSANKGMDAAVRAQIVGALEAEIARLQSPQSIIPHDSIANNSAIGGFSPLPSLSQPKAPDSASLPPPRRIVSAAPDDDYAVLPSIPTAPPPPVHVLGSAAAASLPLLPRPRMTLTCATPGQAVGPCTGFTRDTLLMVSAGEDIPANTSLEFVRDGDPKADIDLAQLKKGKTVRLNVPTDVCLHAVGGRLELRIVRSGQEVGSEGPYYLSC